MKCIKDSKDNIMRRKVRIKERYSIIISSVTDARKKAFTLSVARRCAFAALGAALAVMFILTGSFIFTSSQASYYSAQADELESEAGEQLALIDSYSGELEILRAACVCYEQNYCNAQKLGLLDSKGMLSLRTDGDAAAQQAALSGQTTAAAKTISASAADGLEKDGLTAGAVQVIPMKDAITQINADFQSKIDTHVEVIKATESFDDVKVEFAGDMDGDSDTVNNWADVLSVYAAATMHEGFKFLTITPENIGTLRDIYNEMNQLEFRTDKTTSFAENSDPTAPPVPVTTLNVYVSVNSLTYEEGAVMHSFDRKQAALLARLMSPSYYTYFADLLGVDMYDGTESEDLQQIIASLSQGTKGAAIVQSALIRLGHPYSKSRRGSGNYVDCSYFVYWSYNQAGIAIPTSSVEQARYCHSNGYVVDEKDLKPGDIVFWSKPGCSCGRWREIHHAAIYIGNNKTIEASSCKGRVIIRDLWSGGGWKVALYGRPYSEEAPGVASQPPEVQQ